MALRLIERYMLDPALTDGTPIEPNVPFVPQFLSQWCWAACLSMVTGMPQCIAAGLRFPDLKCCDGLGEGCSESEPAKGDASLACNAAASLSEISKFWTEVLGRSVTHHKAISEEQLIKALEAGDGHAVQVWWVQGAAKHVVLVVGHESGQYLVHDPCAQRRLMSYAELRLPDSYTEWKYTWIL